MSVSRKLMQLDIHGLHALFSDSRNDVVVLNEIKAELDSRWTRAAKSLNKEVIDQINLLSNTEEFDNPIWDKLEVAVTPNTNLAPDGNTTADLWDEGALNNDHRALQTEAVATGTQNVSIYAKYIDCQYVGFRQQIGGTWANAVFDIQNGTLEYLEAAFDSYAIEPAANGFYRISAVMTNRTRDDVKPSMFDTTLTGSGDQFYTGTNRTVVFWGAQLTDGAPLQVYTPN